jgi:hypothetical protein
MQGVRDRLTATGISQKASALITAGWSKGTNSAYQSALSKWHDWCVQRNLHPFSISVSSFANFLASLYANGLQYRTINTVRSAVSVTHGHVEGIPLGQHPVVSRLMKGIYNSRPPELRYATSWCVGQVTTHMKTMGPNNALSLKQLSLKLVTLMALVEASRTSEIAALDLRYRVYSPEGVTFRLPTLTKKRTTGAPPRQLFFGGFPPDERLCVSKCLKQYEEGFRDKTPGAPGRVFLSYVTPHRPVKSQQVAHWIEAMLESAGINTAVYSAQQCTQHTRRGVRLPQRP